MNRKLTAAVVAATAMVLASCGNEEDEVRLAEPVLDFPYTSVTEIPTIEEVVPEETETETEASETETSTSSSTSTKTSTSTSTSTRTSTSARPQASEPAPAPQPQPAPTQPGAACAWPNQSEANGREFATFCDREWARTVLEGQQYFWKARGAGWVSVDPEGMIDEEVCWDPADFTEAPEAIRKAVVYCTPVAETPAAAS